MNTLKTPGAGASVAALLFASALNIAAADTVAFTLDPLFADGSTAGTGLVGFNFTVDSLIEVTQLGFLGVSLGGGDTPWAALYNVDTATLLGSTTFAPVNGWSYVALSSPVILTAGTTYQIVAPAYWSDKYTSISALTLGPEINAVGFTTPAGWGGWGTPTMATNGLTSTPNITANFQYVAAAIPEPSTVAALAGVGVLGLAVSRRRRG